MPRRISLLVVVDRRELERARLETGLFGNFPHHALARGLIDVGPTAGQRPFAVADLAHHQNAVLDEGRAAHVDLRGRVALLLAQQLEQGFMFGGRTLRHQHGRQFAQPLVALLVEAVGAEGQSGLSNGPHLACDFQPLRFLSHRGAKNSVYVAIRSDLISTTSTSSVGTVAPVTLEKISARQCATARGISTVRLKS